MPSPLGSFSNSDSIRIMICTANLGNARPDDASMAALIPPNGSLHPVLDQQTFPIPTREEQQSFMSEIGFKTVLVTRQSQQPLFNSLPPSRETSTTETTALGANTNNCHDESFEQLNTDGIIEHFDIIVLGFQEATFDVDANDPTILAVDPKFRKAVGKQQQTTNHAGPTGGDDSNFISTTATTEAAKKAIRKLDSVGNWLESNDTKLLGSMLHQRCPHYNFMVRFQRGEMRLEILTHKDLNVELLSLAAQNTGMGVNGIMNAPNKGGIFAELLVEKSTRISFCTAHLQAHEGKDRYDDRCRMTAAILEGTAPEGPVNIDLAVRSHFVFFLGDLNFRTELPDAPYLTKEQHHEKVMELVETEDWSQLNMADELFKALRDKDCLVGFKTLPCFFPPTFKVERMIGVKYKDQRRPSYTDRILWKAMHKLEDRVTPLAYEPILDFSSSDHKPVRGAFKIQLNERIQPRQPHEKKRMSMSTKQLFLSSTRLLGGHKDSKLHLFVSDMQCSFRKRAMAPNPIVVFMSFPYALVQEKVNKLANMKRWFRSAIEEEGVNGVKYRIDASGFPRTKKLKATYHPQWLDEIHVVVATHDVNGKPFDMTGSALFIVVIDKSHTIEDRVIGVLPLNLAHLAMSSSETGRPVFRKQSRWNSLRDLFAGHAESSAPMSTSNTLPADNVILNMKRPLTRHGKQTGWISLTLDSKWLSDKEVHGERLRRAASAPTSLQPGHRQGSLRELLGRVTMIESSQEVPVSPSVDILGVSQSSSYSGNGLGTSQRSRTSRTGQLNGLPHKSPGRSGTKHKGVPFPKSPASSVATWQF